MGTKIRKIKIHPTYGLDFLVTLPDIGRRRRRVGPGHVPDRRKLGLR